MKSNCKNCSIPRHFRVMHIYTIHGASLLTAEHERRQDDSLACVGVILFEDRYRGMYYLMSKLREEREREK